MKKTSNILCILNPNASKGQAITKVDKIKESFRKRNQSVDIIFTSQRKQAITLALQGADEGYDVIIAAGGDGTVNEVANGILKSDKSPSFGIIPIGRGNDFAYTANIPCDVDKAVDLILSSPATDIDVGLLYGKDAADGRFFINGAGMGFEPEVNFKASSYKHINGVTSYLLAFLHCFCFIPKPYDIEMRVDDKNINLKTQQISICNGRRMGGAFIMGPRAIINDGKLDVVYANRPLKRLEITRLALRFFSGTQLKSKYMDMLNAESVVDIKSARAEMKIHVDGEEISRDAAFCRIEMVKKGLRLFYNR